MDAERVAKPEALRERRRGDAAPLQPADRNLDDAAWADLRAVTCSLRQSAKRRGCPPDLDEPVVLSSQRHGITVEAATARISKELLVVFNYAEVWGTSTKHSPQRVGLSHVLQDEDVFQIIGQTNHLHEHNAALHGCPA